jgi:uncharacterized protein YdcH (DUF465 family)
MHNEPHDLVHELPEFKDAIHEMKMSDNHFKRLFDEYHTVNKEVHRIEQDIETTSDAYAEDLKKKRLALKDEMYQMLQKKAG